MDENLTIMDIQHSYFAILEHYFEKPYAEMKRHKVTPREIAEQLASNKVLIEGFADFAEELNSELENFWATSEPAIQKYLDELNHHSYLTSIYGGDISPSYTTSIARSVGLYIDTILLPDVLMRANEFSRTMQPQAAIYYTAKHALNLLNYKSLALADINPPIIIIIPNYSLFDRSAHNTLIASSTDDLLLHCTKLFGRTFSNAEDLTIFLKSVSSPSELVAKLADPARLLFNIEEPVDPIHQLDQFLKEYGPMFNLRRSSEELGNILYFSLLGRMLNSNKLLFESLHYNGTPLMDAPTSWQYFLWKYEYDIERGNPSATRVDELLIPVALQGIEFLSNIPEKTLIELRQKGVLAELRETLRQNVHQIDIASPSVLNEVTQTVTNNLNEAFSKHKKELHDHTKSKLTFGFEVGSLITGGGLSIAAAATGNLPLSIASISVGMIGVPTAKDLWKQGKEMVEKSQKLKRSPTGILFRQIGNKKIYS
jgi:hypothetical protein